MVCLLVGAFAFVLFILYDLNQITKNYFWVRPFFGIGCILLACSTVVLSLTGGEYRLPVFLKFVFGGIAFCFFVLLIYSLFFALPFEKTYITGNLKGSVYDKGLYALCRHPGVLFFIGFYFFYWLSIGSVLLLWAAVLYSVLNLLYILIQDRFSFPRIFSNYDVYKCGTPFLIPTLSSFKRCLQTFRS